MSSSERGPKKVRHDESKVVMENKKLKVRIEKLEREIDKMKKQHRRKRDKMEKGLSIFVVENNSGSVPPDPESDGRWFPGVTMNDRLFVQNQDEEDRQFPGVMGIYKNSPPEQYEAEDADDEREAEKEVKKEVNEMEEEEEISPEEEKEQCMNINKPTELNYRTSVYNNGPTDNNIAVLSPPLLCRGVRLGSYKIHAEGNNRIISVYLGMDGISFNAPMVSNLNKMVNVILKPTDITRMLVHFGKCLPMLFIFTTEEFAEAVRKSLDMSTYDFSFYDPLSKDEKEKKITFLIDRVTEEQRNFLRHQFLSEKKVKEIDQSTANQILVKSSPGQKTYMKRKGVHIPPSVQQHTIQSPIAPLTRENVLALTALYKNKVEKCEAIDQKNANGILVKSTPEKSYIKQEL